LAVIYRLLELVNIQQSAIHIADISFHVLENSLKRKKNDIYSTCNNLSSPLSKTNSLDALDARRTNTKSKPLIAVSGSDYKLQLMVVNVVSIGGGGDRRALCVSFLCIHIRM